MNIKLKKPNHDIFISYRRDGGTELAMLVKNALQAKRYATFMDIESLRSGKFNEALYAKIQNSKDFIIILTPGSLERCKNENDWVRKEVKHAIECNCNIVPVLGRDFIMPDKGTLPEEISSLPDYHGIAPSNELWDASINKLILLLKSKPCNRWEKRSLYFVSSLIFICFLVMAIYKLSTISGDFNMTVFTNESRKLQGMTFPGGTVSLYLKDKIEKLSIVDEAIFKKIPRGFKGEKGRVIFESKGYCKVDTLIVLDESVTLPICRDNSLGLLFGIVKDENNLPVAGASVSVKDIYAKTDSSGRFKIVIPFEKQSIKQKLCVYKQRYKLWELTFPVICGEEAKIILKNQ
ncbi:MAG: TIR domain-containing protein [Bacteroidetes bacterium]|nr:TIR domain-containing protein [Bacteroidota bacterium]